MTPASRLRQALGHAAQGLVEREILLELIALGAVAGEHVLVIGPPGTAKSEAARRFASAVRGRSFEYLLGRFTEPAELFGPFDLRRLREGELVTRTEGFLPEADLAFLDEVFLGSTAILNTLLGLLADRRFRRGATEARVPLRVCVGASNALPEDESLAAFADRFLIRAFVAPLADSRLEDLLEAAGRPPAAVQAASLDDLDALSAATHHVDLSGVRAALADAVRALRSAGLSLSDRRLVKAQRLVAAAAALAERQVAQTADLWPLLYTVPTEEGQALARTVLRPLLAEGANPSLPHASEAAAASPAARAARLVTQLDELLAAQPQDPRQLGPWRRRLEGALREVDAGFDAQARPPELSERRARAVAAIR